MDKGFRDAAPDWLKDTELQELCTRLNNNPDDIRAEITRLWEEGKQENEWESTQKKKTDKKKAAPRERAHGGSKSGKPGAGERQPRGEKTGASRDGPRGTAGGGEKKAPGGSDAKENGRKENTTANKPSAAKKEKVESSAREINFIRDNSPALPSSSVPVTAAPPFSSAWGTQRMSLSEQIKQKDSEKEKEKERAKTDTAAATAVTATAAAATTTAAATAAATAAPAVAAADAAATETQSMPPAQQAPSAPEAASAGGTVETEKQTGAAGARRGGGGSGSGEKAPKGRRKNDGKKKSKEPASGAGEGMDQGMASSGSTAAPGMSGCTEMLEIPGLMMDMDAGGDLDIEFGSFGFEENAGGANESSSAMQTSPAAWGFLDTSTTTHIEPSSLFTGNKTSSGAMKTPVAGNANVPPGLAPPPGLIDNSTGTGQTHKPRNLGAKPKADRQAQAAANIPNQTTEMQIGGMREYYADQSTGKESGINGSKGNQPYPASSASAQMMSGTQHSQMHAMPQTQPQNKHNQQMQQQQQQMQQQQQQMQQQQMQQQQMQQQQMQQQQMQQQQMQQLTPQQQQQLTQQQQQQQQVFHQAHGMPTNPYYYTYPYNPQQLYQYQAQFYGQRYQGGRGYNGDPNYAASQSMTGYHDVYGQTGMSPYSTVDPQFVMAGMHPAPQEAAARGGGGGNKGSKHDQGGKGQAAKASQGVDNGYYYTYGQYPQNTGYSQPYAFGGGQSAPPAAPQGGYYQGSGKH